MPGPASSQNDWFAAASNATRALYQRRRRTFPGTVATAANAAGGAGVPGGGGGGGGGDHGGGGVAVPGGQTGYGHILNNEVSQGGYIPASASAAGGAVSAATAAISAPPVASPAATTLSGLAGALYALRRQGRRGFSRGHVLVAVLVGSVLYAGIIARAITGPGQPEGAPLIAPGAKLKLTAAPAGYALASWPDSLAVATGRTSGSIAADGKAFAAGDGSTATAYEPASAAGVPGSLVVLIGTRPNGQRVGVIIRPGVGTAAPWVWYTMKSGTFTQGAAVTEAEKLAIDNATKGILP